jgi:hypothetical protein
MRGCFTLCLVTSAFTLLVACGDSTGGSGSSGGGSGGGESTGSNSTDASSSASGTTTGGGGGLLGFGETCAEDEECESGLCYPFGMGAKCTVECPADPADCPGETKECNNMEPAACKTP